MDREIAVASVVAAEMPPGTPLEALKHKAVIARAYFAAAGPRHDAFRFLRHHRIASSAWTAGAAERCVSGCQRYARTSNRLSRKPFAAMYSASCGGQTRSLRNPGPGLPYRSVRANFAAGIRPAWCRVINSGVARRALLECGASGIWISRNPGTLLSGDFLGAILADCVFLLPPSPAFES